MMKLTALLLFGIFAITLIDCGVIQSDETVELEVRRRKKKDKDCCPDHDDEDCCPDDCTECGKFLKFDHVHTEESHHSRDHFHGKMVIAGCACCCDDCDGECGPDTIENEDLVPDYD